MSTTNSEQALGTQLAATSSPRILAQATTAGDGLPAGLSEEDLTLDGARGAEPAAGAPPAADPGGSSLVESPTWNDFVAGWDQGIYQDPILCGMLAGFALGLLGVFVVLRRAVFVTAAVSQAAGLGVALAFYSAIHLGVSVPPVVGALVLSLLVAGLLAVPVGKWRLPRESWLGFAFIACSAGAVLVGDRIAQEAHDISAILFGTAVLVRKSDLYLVAAAGAVTAAVTLVGHRGFVFSGFDPHGARVQRLPVRTLELTLWAMVAVLISITTRALGALPVFAFAVLPAMAALALAQRLRWVLLVASAIGGVAGGLGYLLAFFAELPVGASQAALCAGVLVVALLLARLRRGLG